MGCSGYTPWRPEGFDATLTLMKNKMWFTAFMSGAVFAAVNRP
jgi:hypothetical protein